MFLFNSMCDFSNEVNSGETYGENNSSTNNNKPQESNGVMVIAVGNRHGGTSSNPVRDRLHFT